MSNPPSPSLSETRAASMEADKRARSPLEEGEEREEQQSEGSVQTSNAPGDQQFHSRDGEPSIYDDPPPLPDEPEPVEDDGWDAKQDVSSGAWYFFNRHTGLSQWENPRTPDDPYGHKAAAAATQSYGVAPGTEADHGAPGTVTARGPPSPPREPYTGYNPRIHGDFDPNADYAKFHQDELPQTEEEPAASEGNIGLYDQQAQFGRFSGSFTGGGSKTAEYHNDENKSKRQMNAFFDVDSAANAHEGKSLKAERANQKLSKKEVKAFNERRRTRKEQKRRDFLLS